MKHCYNCVHHWQLVNQGITLCNCPAFDGEDKSPFDAEKCGHYYQNAIKDYADYVDSKIVSEIQKEDGRIGQIAQYRINCARRKRKNERGVKHGRRK